MNLESATLFSRSDRFRIEAATNRQAENANEVRIVFLAMNTYDLKFLSHPDSEPFFLL